MFKLRRPCPTCPFRRGQGRLFELRRERLLEILRGPAFQCHKTVDYAERSEGQPGDKPQQCAGLMAFLWRLGRPNQIMQVAERLAGVDFERLDRSDVYADLAELFGEHCPKEDVPDGRQIWH